MEKNKIIKILKVFEPSVSTSEADSFADSAISMISMKLKENTDTSNENLNYLAASLAKLMYVQNLASKYMQSVTVAGKIATEFDMTPQVTFANALFMSYKKVCRDLLIDDTFNFKGV